MKRKLIKVGQGMLHGLSTKEAYKGKKIKLYDGKICLAMISLDVAYPSRFYTDTNGNLHSEPGINMHQNFMSDLKMEMPDNSEIEVFFR